MADLQLPMLNLSDVAQLPENTANMQLVQNQSGVAAQQAQGLNIANQRAAIGLQLYKNVLNDFSGQPFQGVPDDSSSAPGAAAGAPAGDSGDNSADSSSSAPPSQAGAGGGPQSGGSDASGEDDGINSVYHGPLNAQLMRRMFFVNPAGNARSQDMLLEASMTGDPGLMSYAKNQRDLQVQSDTAVSQKRAQDLYDTFGMVASAPKGAALALLGRFSPADAALIRQAYPNDPTDQDAAARESAAHMMAMSHQFTGRPLTLGPDGVYRDKVTGQRVPVPVAGMSPADYANLSAKGEAMVSVPNSDGTSTQMPLWQANKAPSLAAWTAQQAARGQAFLHPSVAPAVKFFAAAAYGPPGGPQAPGAPGAQTAPGAPQRPQQAPQQPAPTPAQQAYNQQLSRALQDPEYRMQQPRVVAGQTATPAALAQQQETVKSRAQLMQDSQSATQAAANSLVYLRAAQAVMANPNKPPTGLSAPLQSVISRAMQAAGISSGDWATQYAQLAKYLGNAALTNAKATYGARMTASEVNLQLNALSPSAHMTPAAINALLAENVSNAQYTLAAARNVRPYLLAGNDPQSFAEWQQQYFPRGRTVNKLPANPAATPNTSAAPAPATQAPPAAVAYLAAHPQLAGAFRAKYGYLPQGISNGR
jgi:hypothetical protein